MPYFVKFNVYYWFQNEKKYLFLFLHHVQNTKNQNALFYDISVSRSDFNFCFIVLIFYWALKNALIKSHGRKIEH